MGDLTPLLDLRSSCRHIVYCGHLLFFVVVVHGPQTCALIIHNHLPCSCSSTFIAIRGGGLHSFHALGGDFSSRSFVVKVHGHLALRFMLKNCGGS